MKKINLKLILLQLIGVFLLINGIQRLYVSSQAEKYNCIMNKPNSDCWDKYGSYQTIGDFFAERGFWAVYAFALCIIAISVLNWKYKKSILNTFIVAISILILFPTGIFFRGFVNNILNYYGGFFTKDFGLSFFIGGSTYTLFGIVFLILSIKMKSTTHNSGFEQVGVSD